MRCCDYAREKARLDAISRMKYAEIKGIEKGKEEGKVELVIRQLRRNIA